MMKVKTRIDLEKCDACGNCVRVCPIDCWEVPLGQKARFSGEDRCMLCYFCETECPALAIKLEKMEE